jgi:hypothetical protein
VTAEVITSMAHRCIYAQLTTCKLSKKKKNILSKIQIKSYV